MCRDGEKEAVVGGIPGMWAGICSVHGVRGHVWWVARDEVVVFKGTFGPSWWSSPMVEKPGGGGGGL